MLLFLLSLAGIPFVVGFWAKLYVFVAAWQAGLHAMVFVGAVLAVVGPVLLLQVARAMYMRKPHKSARVPTRPALRLAIVVCVAGVVGVGAWPSPLLEQATQAAQVVQSTGIGTKRSPACPDAPSRSSTVWCCRTGAVSGGPAQLSTLLTFVYPRDWTSGYRAGPAPWPCQPG